MGTRTITTIAVLTTIRIDPPHDGSPEPRVVVEGQVQDEQGRLIESVVVDVYPSLSAAQKTRVGDIIAAGNMVVARAAGDDA